MKLKMKRQGQTELPRFVIGALATAGASAADGATVQITFANNVVNSITGLNASWQSDLTGDGTQDVIGAWVYGAGAVGGRVFVGLSMTYLGNSDRVELYSNTAMGGFSVWKDGVIYQDGGTIWPASLLAPFAFSDSNINTGVVNGWLDISANSQGGGNVSLQIHRLIFDDTSGTAPKVDSSVTYQAWTAVPEPSSLALLALGAGGLLARRRRAA